MYLCTMQNNKRFLLSAAWVMSLHILTLLFLSLFRLVEYMALGSMVSDHLQALCLHLYVVYGSTTL